jgi:hypothetical protein
LEGLAGSVGDSGLAGALSAFGAVGAARIADVVALYEHIGGSLDSCARSYQGTEDHVSGQVKGIRSRL